VVGLLDHDRMLKHFSFALGHAVMMDVQQKRAYQECFVRLPQGVHLQNHRPAQHVSDGLALVMRRIQRVVHLAETEGGQRAQCRGQPGRLPAPRIVFSCLYQDLAESGPAINFSRIYSRFIVCHI